MPPRLKPPAPVAWLVLCPNSIQAAILATRDRREPDRALHRSYPVGLEAPVEDAQQCGAAELFRPADDARVDSLAFRANSAPDSDGSVRGGTGWEENRRALQHFGARLDDDAGAVGYQCRSRRLRRYLAGEHPKRHNRRKTDEEAWFRHADWVRDYHICALSVD